MSQSLTRLIIISLLISLVLLHFSNGEKKKGGVGGTVSLKHFRDRLCHTCSYSKTSCPSRSSSKSTEKRNLGFLTTYRDFTRICLPKYTTVGVGAEQIQPKPKSSLMLPFCATAVIPLDT